jgi:hypothetical protein
MGNTLHSSSQAALMAKVSPITLYAWLRNQEFETAQVSEHSKTHERTYYFTEADVMRLAEFVAKRAEELKSAGRIAVPAQSRRATG